MDEIKTDEEKAALRKKNTEYQRKRRARIKEKEIAERNRSREEFWAASRKSADAGQLKQWEERQDFVLSLIGDINAVRTGEVPDEYFEADVVEEIADDVKEFGVCGITVPLLIGNYWMQPQLLAKLTNGDSPSHIFAKYGFITTIDDWTLHKWEEHLASQKALTNLVQPAGNGYVILQCACKTPITSFEAVPVSIAQAYARAGKKWLCTRCRNAEQSARAQMNVSIESRRPTGPSTIFDSWGRIKTPEQEKEV